ncbi:3'(2'),5'-bisphosphate nucleotidase CysQ [Formicincola oecophyllae]|uniref:3'(2'),5-bisphosphonucleoside 3'(2')-phosphohydrolase n=1 Tax=Formicincola oecophyllae TaxID=2558361 RepID=A0A4Y6UD23_9PROT|nr:3'(2'),5'-bisphosphate nucleotidase CysQ [Formicincola oecophyllae]QDH14281.1 3'(2'),5'-bisphosphate nucleotidase CysQ [Formicincola oecophyllae]
MPEDVALLAMATSVARGAAEVIRTIRARGFTTTIKADTSPVTEADNASERYILQKLRAYRPDIAAIAEEESAAGVHMETGQRYWLVDPLDGTRGFTEGRDHFAVNIGLVEGDQALLGAVVLPASGEVYAGGKGLGAWKIHERTLPFDQTGAGTVQEGLRLLASATPIVARTTPPDGVRMLASRYRRTSGFTDPQMLRWLQGRHVHSVKRMGSAEKMVRVAEGSADFFPRLGPTMEWDTAAPQAIVEAAGGQLVDRSGEPLRYGKAGRLNHHFCCMGKGW